MKPHLIEYASEYLKVSKEAVIDGMKVAKEGTIFHEIDLNTYERNLNLLHPIMKIVNAKILVYGDGIGEVARDLTTGNEVYIYEPNETFRNFSMFVSGRQSTGIEYLKDEKDIESLKFNLAIVLKNKSKETIEKVMNRVHKDCWLLTLDLPTEDDNMTVKSELLQYLVERGILYFFHITNIGIIYLWRKK